jgi:acetylornithine deacetylase/succinyl-diaminopimelate desuccinylase-like protein
VTILEEHDVDSAWTEELFEFLSIPSISASPDHREDVWAAAQWVQRFLERLGGDVDIRDFGSGLPLLIGEVSATGSHRQTPPTVLLYGHVDVQPVEPRDAWDSEPFSPSIRDGWIYARGAADDKGNFYLLLKALERLARARRLPVDVRVICDGEEEVIGHSIVDFLRADDRGADACLLLDGPMPRRDVPAFKLGQRGILFFHVTVTTGRRELHSGLFGGAALNAASVLAGIIAAVVGAVDELREGTEYPTREELSHWERLDAGCEVLSREGAAPADAGAAGAFYSRIFAETAIDVNGFLSGEPILQKTVLPVEAQANISIRLAPGQDPQEISGRFGRLVEGATPTGAQVAIEEWAASPAVVVPPDSNAVLFALEAFEQVLGIRPVLMRSGGTLPVVAALVEAGIPAVVSGFDVPEGNVHAPNERLLLKYVPLGVAAAEETLVRFADL